MSYLDDLLIARTFEEWQDVVRASAAFVGWNVDALPRRSRLRAVMLQVIPDIAVAASAAHVPAIRGMFRDLATGTWLKERARQVYDVEPFEETFCTVQVTLTNPDALPYEASAGEVIVQNAVTNETYRNISDIHLDAAGGPLDTITTDFIARNPGSIADAEAGDISILQSGGLGGVTVTNPTIGRGSDEESEASIRDRMRLALASFSPAGPADAYAYIARSAVRLPDGTYDVQRASDPAPEGAVSVGVSRVQVLEHEPEIGDVSMYLADADGALAGADVTGIHGLVLLLARPTSVNYLGTFAAVEVTINVTYTVTVRAADGFTSLEVQGFIATALGAVLTSPREAPIGGLDGFFYRVAIIDAIKAAQPPGALPTDPRPVVDVPLGSLLPAADVALTAGQVPVLGTITPTVTFI